MKYRIRIGKSIEYLEDDFDGLIWVSDRWDGRDKYWQTVSDMLGEEFATKYEKVDEVMMYIGFNDMNGEEIYEKDSFIIGAQRWTNIRLHPGLGYISDCEELGITNWPFYSRRDEITVRRYYA